MLAYTNTGYQYCVHCPPLLDYWGWRPSSPGGGSFESSWFKLGSGTTKIRFVPFWIKLVCHYIISTLPCGYCMQWCYHSNRLIQSELVLFAALDHTQQSIPPWYHHASKTFPQLPQPTRRPTPAHHNSSGAHYDAMGWISCKTKKSSESGVISLSIFIMRCIVCFRWWLPYQQWPILLSLQTFMNLHESFHRDHHIMFVC